MSVQGCRCTGTCRVASHTVSRCAVTFSLKQSREAESPLEHHFRLSTERVLGEELGLNRVTLVDVFAVAHSWRHSGRVPGSPSGGSKAADASKVASSTQGHQSPCSFLDFVCQIRFSTQWKDIEVVQLVISRFQSQSAHFAM